MPNKPDDAPAPMAVAMTWVSRIMVVVAEMVLPGLAGQWVDKRLGTQHWTLIGFAVGLTLAIWHLLRFQKLGQRRNSAGDR